MRLLYTIWCGFWFISIFILLFPFFYIFLQKEEWKPKAHYLNRLWGKIFFFIVGIKLEIEYEFVPNKSKNYVFCANHFSYLDIATMGVILDNYYAFVGKHDAGNVPLFGYMFKHLHISVDRENAKSRVLTLSRTLKTLKSGRSIMIFPEGGIRTKNAPQMHLPLMDGAFSMAIQTQVPIVPVSLLTNYKIMPDESPIRLYRMPMKAIVHQPIITAGLTNEDIVALKEQFYNTVQKELN